VTPAPRARWLTTLAGALALAACSATPTAKPNPTPAPPLGSATPSRVAVATPVASASASPSPSPSPTCVEQTYAALTPDQRLGQLVMVALGKGAPAASLRPTTEGSHVGNVVYLGGWSSGIQDVTATSALLQKQATPAATGGVGMLIAADQEGGKVQQLKGDFTTMPSAVTQGTWSAETLQKRAGEWSTQLKGAGVNVNFAPVADTVPEELGTGNGPIGRWQRQFGATPAAVSTSVTAFVRGTTGAKVVATVKHFPGIGRIRGNTDYVTSGLDDTVMTVDDPYLQPFVDGWHAGGPMVMVMVSSATYPKVDPDNPAMFSPAIVDGLLRSKLGFTGVAITDDIDAASVKAVPVADRATRFVGAGGDILLTGDTPSAPALVDALRTASAGDAGFAKRVETSVKRVLTLKQAMGLLPSCPAP